MKLVFDIRGASSGGGGGGGGVTNIGTGNGLDGGPITSTGVISLATVGAGNMLANLTGFTDDLLPHSLPDILDYVFDDAQGTILYRGSTAWTYLAPGTTGQVLVSGGPSGDPSWAGGTGGTVTSVDSGTGLTGGPITSSGSLALAAIDDSLFLTNISGSAATPTPTNISDFFDYVFTSAQGAVLYRKGSEWTFLPHGTDGQLLRSGGAGADISWTSAGAGTVTSVASGTGLTGGPITASGTLSLASINSHYILANVTGSSAPPLPNTVSDVLDAAFNGTQGNLLYRNATQWTYLTPGSAGTVLTSGGTGANLSWQAGGGGGSGTVTSVATGTGLTGGPVTTTGTISLSTIGSGLILANITGGTAAPIPNSLSAIMDFSFNNAQGNILYRGDSGWTYLAPGTSGQVLKTNGAAANPSWADSGSGTVTSVASGTGLTGGPISTTGTLSLANINSHYVLANVTGTSAPPLPNTVSDVLDAAFNATQGNILYRNATQWTYLVPGAAGTVLTSNGTGANIAWAPSSGGGSGTVTSVATGAGLSGGPITTSGTISLSTISSGTLLSNITGGTTTPSANTLSSIMDFSFNNAQGNILYRGASGWTYLAPGTSGQLLQSGGASANPSWVSPGSGSGTVTSVDTGTGLTGGPVTTSGTIAFANIASKYMLANTTGTSAPPLPHTVSDVLDSAFTATQGSILYRSNATWSYLVPGTPGYFLATGGASANPSWQPGGGGSGNHVYEDTQWVAKNGEVDFSGFTINAPEFSFQYAIDALPDGGVINIPDNGTYSGNFVFADGKNYVVNAPGAKFLAVTGILFTASGGSTITIYCNDIDALNGILDLDSTSNIYIYSPHSLGPLNNDGDAYLWINIIEGSITTSKRLNLTYDTMVGDLLDTSSVDASPTVYLTGKVSDGDISSTNSQIYAHIGQVTGAVSGIWGGRINNYSYNEQYNVVNVTTDYTVQKSDCNKALGIYNVTGTIVITLPSYATSGPLPNGFRVYAWQGYEGGGAQFVVEGDDTLQTRDGRYTRIGKQEAILTSNSTISPYNRIWTLTGDLGGS